MLEVAVPNRHLKRARYRPRAMRPQNWSGSSVSQAGGGITPGDSAPLGRSGGDNQSRPAHIVHVKNSLRDLTIQGLFLVAAATVTAATGIMAIRRVDGSMSSEPPYRPAVVEPPLISVLVQRLRDTSSVAEEIAALPPVLQSIAVAWNAGSRRSVLGIPTSALPYLLPVERPGHRGNLEVLLGSVAADIWLYLIYPPLNWTQLDLDARIFKWATNCGVDPSWIRTWSSFLTHPKGRMSNQCKPGGLCVVLSIKACDGRAFDDFSPGT